MIYDKCNGHNAHCGIKISYDDFQVDHIIPKRFWLYASHTTNLSVDDISNLLPVCNHYKRVLDLETFRNKWLSKLHTRIKKIPKKPRTERGKRRKEYMHRILDRYHITENKPFDGIFYFEKK